MVRGIALSTVRTRAKWYASMKLESTQWRRGMFNKEASNVRKVGSIKLQIRGTAKA